MFDWLTGLLRTRRPKAPPSQAAHEAWDAYRLGDYRRALGLARTAAEEGDASAQSLLGHLYDEGHGVEHDGSEAMTWYHRAAEGGDPHGQYMVGREAERWSDLTTAARWYRLAAEQGHDVAQFKLGEFHRAGQGANRDYVEAYSWYVLSSRQGDADAAAAMEGLRGLMSPNQIAEANRRADERLRRP